MVIKSLKQNIPDNLSRAIFLITLSSIIDLNQTIQPTKNSRLSHCHDEGLVSPLHCA